MTGRLARTALPSQGSPLAAAPASREGGAVRPLHLLIVDDSANDAELLVRALRRGGLAAEWRRVASGDTLTTALQRETWDLITCDIHMPGFGGPQAMRLIVAHAARTPVIVVSGIAAAPEGVEMLRAGARAIVGKDRLDELPAVVAELTGLGASRD